MWLGLAVGIVVPYFTLQHVEIAPTRQVPALWLDDAVAFEPAWVIAYLSIALLVPLGPGLATRRDELVRYAWGLALLCVVSFVAFALFPVDGPRPPLPARNGIYDLLVSVDRPANSMPSLHAGLVVYSLLFLDRVLRDLPAVERRALRAVGVVWGGLILFATLATKQHWAIDLLPAALLAWVAHGFAWRGAAVREG